MTNTTDKGIKLMKPTFFKDNDPNNPKRKTYIEREAEKKMFEDDYNFDASTAIDKISTADVVEVVRCKDCKHNVFEQANPIIHCNRTGKTEFRECDDFCKYGKRKKVATNG